MTNTRRLRALLVAFHYPPEGGSGTQRTLKFSRYLPEFGWAVDVLTPREDVHQLLDRSLLDEIPDEVTIHRTRAYDIARFGIRGRYPGFLAFPDRYLSWWPFAVWRGRRLLSGNRFDAVYSTSPIRTAHLIGWTISRLHGLPWICDLRDPWLSGAEGIRFRVLSFLERGLLRAADRIIVNTGSARRDLLRRLGSEAADKVCVLPNGYDEADFEGLEASPVNKSDRLTMVHTGEIYPDLRDPRPLLKVVAGLIQQGVIGARDLQIRFLGPGPALENEQFGRWLEEQGLSETVLVDSHVDHRTCVRELLRSEVLLLLQCSPLTNSQTPAKVFEYLRAGQSLLALTPLESATAEVLKEETGCWVVGPDDEKGMEGALLDLISRHRTSTGGQAVGRGSQYERRALTGRLAELLRTAVEARSTAMMAPARGLIHED
jgi:glycosyltransferase involved in cell wall biosynthesis